MNLRKWLFAKPKKHKWTKNDKRFMVGIVIWLIVALYCSILMTIQHELVHQRVYTYYGYNSSIHLTWWGGYTQLDNNETVNATDKRDIAIFNSVNELVSYQYYIMFMFVIGSYMFIIATFYSFTKRREKKDESKTNSN